MCVPPSTPELTPAMVLHRSLHRLGQVSRVVALCHSFPSDLTLPSRCRSLLGTLGRRRKRSGHWNSRCGLVVQWVGGYSAADEGRANPIGSKEQEQGATSCRVRNLDRNHRSLLACLALTRLPVLRRWTKRTFPTRPRPPGQLLGALSTLVRTPCQIPIDAVCRRPDLRTCLDKQFEVSTCWVLESDNSHGASVFYTYGLFLQSICLLSTAREISTWVFVPYSSWWCTLLLRLFIRPSLRSVLQTQLRLLYLYPLPPKASHRTPCFLHYHYHTSIPYCLYFFASHPLSHYLTYKPDLCALCASCIHNSEFGHTRTPSSPYH